MIDLESALLRRPFVFMRHGETPMNARGLICGATDVPLSSEGEEQARRAAWLGRYPWSCVASSGMQRAQHTARLAVGGHPVIALPGLNERHWGQLELAPLAEQTPYEVTPPGGESWAAFRQRVLAALNSVLECHEWPLFVAHSGVYRVIRELQTGTPHGPRIENAQPILVKPHRSGWELTLCEENWLEHR
ncbi:histidine phosphatase family protein [Marinobacterium marinum]|uniref:phosphoglycerate mutase (2,3-diphosphoglycerate-dependent) n=1 Tax=Marinobacterium marinum TaxID=2756129 RepID=A0A7W1WYM1_9GAMM|nr:histidine phosphatase family protein [Marinobacterium marinum]MBA4502637.1 histidine phosphatase family protein [Marinobacterium marinum]